MKLEKVKIGDIKPYPKNAKLHPTEQLGKIRDSILSFGYNDPIAIDENNEIIEGHGRLDALFQINSDKERQIEVIRLTGLNDDQKKAYRIAHNKLNLDSGFDFEVLKEEFHDLEDTDFFHDTGFDTKEISEIWDEKVEEDNFQEPTEPKYKVTRGDIFQLGDHRLMCGDSTSKEDVDKLMNGQKADMVFTDPPYGMNLDTDWSDAKSKLSFVEEKGLKQFSGNKYKQVIGDNIDFNPIFIFDYFDCKEIFLWGADYYKEFIPKTGSWFVWDKRSNEGTELSYVSQSDKMYGSCFELLWSKEKHKREIARFKWAGIFGTEREPDKDKGRVHPTQKPVDLCKWFIEKFSEKDKNIIDIFGGSGSTLVACEQLKRKCYMMEIDPIYCSVILERWEKLTGKEAKRLGDD